MRCPLQLVTEENARKVSNSDAVVPVQPRGEEVTASLDETEDMELIGSLQSVYSKIIKYTGIQNLK